MARGQSDASVHPSWNEYPELFAELDLSKNKGLTFRGKPIKAFELTCGTNKKLDWKCSECDHEWKAACSDRVVGNGCPACANRAIHVDGRNSMANTHLELAIEYQGDATKIIAGTKKRLEWKCSECDHKWRASGDDRVFGNGCPACHGSLHSDGRNSMANTHPELAIEYQGDATKIIAGTHKKLDWKCSDCEHEWITTGNKRTHRGQGCPACSKSGYDPSIIGYVYINRYLDSNNIWLKCGITNKPYDRINRLKQSAKEFKIDVSELEIYKFDDGFNAQLCESELLSMKGLRFDSGYDVEGKSEFFKFEALDEIKKIINNWL